MSHRVLIIGRDPGADIHLADDSVSRFHAELVVGSGGEVYVIDRSSSAGTRRLVDGAWQTVRQAGVSSGDQLCFGDHEISVQTLLERVPVRAQANNPELPEGQAVQRDPVSGEVIRR